MIIVTIVLWVSEPSGFFAKILQSRTFVAMFFYSCLGQWWTHFEPRIGAKAGSATQCMCFLKWCYIYVQYFTHLKMYGICAYILCVLSVIIRAFSASVFCVYAVWEFCVLCVLRYPCVLYSVLSLFLYSVLSVCVFCVLVV